MVEGVVGPDNGSKLTLRNLVIFQVLAFQFPQRDALCIREQGQNADFADSLPHQLDHIVRRHLFDGGIQGLHHVQAQKRGKSVIGHGAVHTGDMQLTVL